MGLAQSALHCPTAGTLIVLHENISAKEKEPGRRILILNKLVMNKLPTFNAFHSRNYGSISTVSLSPSSALDAAHGR